MTRPETAVPVPRHRTRVSVVIPVRDDAEELARCLRALAAQSRRPDEIVVVDNGSSDSSAATARGAGARVVRCELPGIPIAAARGYDTVLGDLVLRLDADCVPPSDWVERVCDAFSRSPKLAAVTGAARFLDGPRALRTPLAVAYLAAYTAVCGAALGHRPLFGSNMAFRRSAWMRVRGRVHRDERELHDDLDLSFHLGDRHRIRRLRGAPVGISMRPFQDGRAFARRIVRGVRTVVVHWPADLPPVRWVRLALLRALRPLPSGPGRPASARAEGPAVA